MHGSRHVFNVESAVRKLSSRFRRPSRVSPPEWPVISATRPLFYFFRFFGLAPFKISEDNFISGPYDVLYSLFCVVVHTYAIYTVFNKPALKRDTSMLDIIETARVLFNYLVTLSNVLMAVWTRKEFIGVLNIVKHFDSRIRDLGYPRNEKATKVWVWSTSVCTTFLWITVSRFGLVTFPELWIDNMAYLISYLSNSLSTIKFSSIVLLLGQRFRHLNRVAQRSKESVMIKQKYIARDFKVIQHLHNSLMNAGDSLSSQYSWLLLLWLMNLCAHSINNLYYLIDWVMVTPSWAETQWPLVNLLAWWLVTFAAQLLLLHVTCHFTSTEANSMGTIAVNWDSSTVSPSYILEYSLHFINRKLNFSAAGCFHVNLPLLRSIATLLTTYLIILFQFHR